MMQENMGSYYGPSFYHTPPDWGAYHEARQLHEHEVVTPAPPVNRVSWGAVFAGVALTLAAQLIFSLMGLGVAAAGIAPAASRMPAGAFLFLICLWWAASGIAAAFIGGFTAGRMAGKQPASAAAWHGLVSWAVSVMVVAFLLVSATNIIAGEIYQTTLYRSMTGAAYEQDGRINGSSLTEGPAIPAAPSAIPQPGISIDQSPASTSQYSLKVSPPPGSIPAELASFGLLSAAALMLGGLAAWFGGRAGAGTRQERAPA